MTSDQVTSERSDTALFAESEAGGLSFGSLLLILLCLVLVFGGFYLMSLAFGDTAYAIEFFMGGLIATFVSFWLGFTSLKN